MSLPEYYTKKYEDSLTTVGELGVVLRVFHPVVHAEGLPGAFVNEIVYFESGELGFVTALNKDYVEILVLSEVPAIVSSKVSRSGKYLGINVGRGLLGKSVDALGKPLDDRVLITTVSDARLIDSLPKGIVYREKITKPFETGVSVVDMMIPLGKGQKELIIGDRKVGKTQFIFQTMLHQSNLDTIIIYAGIGKQRTSIKKVEEFVKNAGIEHNTIIISSSASDSLGMIYLTPYSAMTIAEYFKDQGKDVLLILDDLTTHAKYYREVSLMSKKFPGREAYPGDVFYSHARLLERAGNFKTDFGYPSSITCLPLVETVEGDISGYIQTNLMSITDGHIFFDNELFKKGQKPAVNYFLSVTRVGRQTQSKLRWSVNRELASFLSLLNKTQSFIHFGTELNEGIRSTISMGDLINEFFNQPIKESIPTNIQILFYALIWSGAFSGREPKEIQPLLSAAVKLYATDQKFTTQVNDLINNSQELNILLGNISPKIPEIISLLESAK